VEEPLTMSVWVTDVRARLVGPHTNTTEARDITLSQHAPVVARAGQIVKMFHFDWILSTETYYPWHIALKLFQRTAN